MRNDVITLISQTYAQNDYGVQIPTETTRDIYCDVKSISQREFYAAGEAGLKPELRFDVFAYDYNGEKLIEHNGNRYAVYRTYQASNNVLELYTHRKVGIEWPEQK